MEWRRWNSVGEGRNKPAAERTVWEILLEMERFKYQAGEKYQGAVALVLGVAQAFKHVSLFVVWAWATHFNLPRKILRVLCGYLEHQRGVHFQGCVAEPLQTITPFSQGRSGAACSCVLCLQDALSEDHK